MKSENVMEKGTALSIPSRLEAREIAAIDLGSNSFHMIVARIMNGSIQILSRLKQKVQLAEGLDENNVLNQAAITRGVNCLALFAERLQGFAPENVNVVGTYTLRRAVNNDEFYAKPKLFSLIQSISLQGKPKRKLFMLVCHTPNLKLEKNLSLILAVARLK